MIKMINKFLLSALFLSLIAVPVLSSDHSGVLTLEQCLDIAVRNNSRLRSAEWAVNIEKTGITEAESRFYPQVSIRSSASGYHNERSGVSSESPANRNYQAGLYASYPVFEGFSRTASREAARSGYLAAEESYSAELMRLEMDVTGAYYRLLQSERLVEVSEKSLQRSKVHLDYAKARFSSGLATRFDVMSARVEHSNARLSLITASNSRLATAGRLNILLGRSAHHSISIADNLESGISEFHLDSLSMRANVKNLINEAFSSRPELLELEHRLKAQRAAISIARSDYFPSVSLDGNYGYSGNSISEMSSSAYIGLSLNIPVFSGFDRRARKNREIWNLRKLESRRKELREQVSLEVWEAYLSVKEARERNVSNIVFYKNARDNLRIAEAEYREGIGAMPDVIDAETVLVSAEEGVVRAMTDYQIALAELERSVGSDEIEEIIQ